MSSSREKLSKLILQDIFKFDLAELDFGIYRILNYRRTTIEHYIQQELPLHIMNVLGSKGRDRIAEVREKLGRLRDDLNDTAAKLGFASAFENDMLIQLKDTPLGTAYLVLAAELPVLEAGIGFTLSEEEAMYNVLYTFFSRYYSDGDFQTQSRRSRTAPYMVPYRGEDVLFHWHNRGSHYVKTAEELRTYTYRDDSGCTVRFDLIEAVLERDNNKSEMRYFVPLVDRTFSLTDSETFVVPFNFRPLTSEEINYLKEAEKDHQETLQDTLIALTLSQLPIPSALSADRFAYHLRRYVRKNRSDYFVHPNLGEFLVGELDYFLTNEYLRPEAFTSPEKLSELFRKYQVLRETAQKLIKLLSAVESFQARLFEKRKFVLETGYLILLLNVPREMWSEIIANQKQIDTWRQWFGLEGTVTEEVLRTHPTLVIDTRYFSREFTLRALGAFEDIDAMTDGVLVHGENYAALRTLEPTYRGKVKVIYIDPPYNTGNDGFLYKDDFARHSTWLTMMEDRLRLGREMLSEDGVIFISIDDNEVDRMRQLMDDLFGVENFIAQIVWEGANKNDVKLVSTAHDYVNCYAKSRLHIEQHLY